MIESVARELASRIRDMCVCESPEVPSQEYLEAVCRRALDNVAHSAMIGTMSWAASQIIDDGNPRIARDKILARIDELKVRGSKNLT